VFSAAGLSEAPFPAPPQRSQRLLPGAIGRLEAGVSLEQAQARLDALSAELVREYPSDYPALAKWAPRVLPVREALVGSMRTELVNAITGKNLGLGAFDLRLRLSS
jgi:hypothetical protein